jgi:predicted nucleic acid-binding protein
MIHLDTSVLVDALVAPGRGLAALDRAIADGEQLHVSAITLFEWLRGPRTAPELSIQTLLFPDRAIVAFGESEARAAARIYRTVRRARGREADLAISACAVVHGARLWTLNPRDFRDIPGLMLYHPPS